ncbi:MAG: hypothetical protein ABW321_22520 [Polyangiales bacterium]
MLGGAWQRPRALAAAAGLACVGLAAVGCDADPLTVVAEPAPARLSVLFDVHPDAAGAFTGYVSVASPVAGEYLGLGVRESPEGEVTPLDPAGLCVPAVQERELHVNLTSPTSRLVVFLGRWQHDERDWVPEAHACASAAFFRTEESLSIRRAAIVGPVAAVAATSLLDRPPGLAAGSGQPESDTDAGAGTR